MASLLNTTTATVLNMATVSALAVSDSYATLAYRTKPKPYPTGKRASGAATVDQGGRRFGARVVGVKWEKKGRDNAAGLPGWEPVPVFRVGNQRPPERRLNARPLSGLTLPRRCGAHGR